MRPIRKAARLLLLFLLVPALCVITAWADVADPCDSISGPGSYRNLAPPDGDYIRWDDPPDRSYLCQQNNRSAASAVYRCSDAREVTVAIYSRYGSYAGYSGGELVRGGDELPLRYQSSTGEVYCDGRRMAYDPDSREFIFLEEGTRPSGLVEYGLSVYCSGDGADYTRVPARLISAWQEGPDTYWYEVYQADLEEGTRYLRLVLTDQSSIEILGREGRYQFETAGGLSLASVEIVEGEDTAPPYGNGKAGYDEGDWETGEPGANSLPSYQPGEEEGPESLPWGPNESQDGSGPAFPEEAGDREEDRRPGEVSSGDGSSSSGSPESSSKSQPRQRSAQTLTGQGGTSREAPEEPAGTGGSTPALRREAPLWRRVMEPDAMSMMIISGTLFAMGVRILCESGDSNRNGHGKRGKRKEQKEQEEQEEQYARYMSYDSDTRRDRGSRRSKNRRKLQLEPVRWDDEDIKADWEDPDG